MNRSTRLLALLSLSLALSLTPRPAAGQPANPNDTLQVEEKAPPSEGSPFFAYAVVGLLSAGSVAAICKSARRSTIGPPPP